mmetsp:Transcript_6834/g.15629  ORF Transcript_6834/g.15629 Transcript_6834/m.15629 type:complete len:121 (-) Transcript_6834:1401-1763(-)
MTYMMLHKQTHPIVIVSTPLSEIFYSSIAVAARLLIVLILFDRVWVANRGWLKISPLPPSSAGLECVAGAGNSKGVLVSSNKTKVASMLTFLCPNLHRSDQNWEREMLCFLCCLHSIFLT